MGKPQTIRIGQVVSVKDDMGGGRIQVRIRGEHGKNNIELPYAFPLLPKTIQSPPKKGEAVLIITSQGDNGESQRFYIGPVISQKYGMYEEPYNDQYGQSTSLLQSAIVGPRVPLNQYSITKGAFPNENDVAIVGRRSEDITLKGNEFWGEVDIRCGARRNIEETEGTPLKGFLVYNSENPVYMQMRYQKGIVSDGDGIINLVADKINLVSHKDTNLDNLTTTPGGGAQVIGDKVIVDDNYLISQFEEVRSKLHNAAYGDVLIPILETMCNAILNHVHHLGTTPPDQEEGSVVALKEKMMELNNISSPHIKIS